MRNFHLQICEKNWVWSSGVGKLWSSLQVYENLLSGVHVSDILIRCSSVWENLIKSSNLWERFSLVSRWIRKFRLVCICVWEILIVYPRKLSVIKFWSALQGNEKLRSVWKTSVVCACVWETLFRSPSVWENLIKSSNRWEDFGLVDKVYERFWYPCCLQV